ncbi:MAG: HAMP domain-containing protein [Acidobacteria bacterium]|nr:HAMP domain-containing protein [Acidobacteriota bacterium]
MRARLGIKGKQVLSVTSLVGVVVVAVSLLYLARLAQVSLVESHARAEMLARTLFYRAREVVVAGSDPYEQLRADSGLRSILTSSLGVKNIMFAAIVNTHGSLIASDPALQYGVPGSAEDLNALLNRSAFSQLRAIYRGQGRNVEVRQPLLIGDAEIGSIRIGVSTLLIRDELDDSLGFAALVALVALAMAVLVSSVLAQLILRPIHIIRGGLTRLSRGESGVQLDLDRHDEFGELGTSFNTVSAQLSADRSQGVGQAAPVESAVEHLEDAVAILSPSGELLFANPAAQALFPQAAIGSPLTSLVSAGHAMGQLVERTLAVGQSQGPVSAAFDSGERLVLGHPVRDADGTLVGVMVIVRNLAYLSRVQSTVRYSRKLAALGRLSAGVAHEVKNPLNAMMIHLELLRQQFAPPTIGVGRALRGAPAGALATDVAAPAPSAGALQHIDVIAREIRRLDEVVQGFLKFSRPEDLTLQLVRLPELLQEIVSVLQPEADRAGVVLSVGGDDVPDVNGDPAMLRQAFLNLGLNACQAMPNGGTLRMRCEATRGRRVAVSFADDGVGIGPEHLQRVFDLYFTTKAKGSGIGLSMVFRTVQMHDGEIEVQSTLGVGTVFTLLLPQA